MTKYANVRIPEEKIRKLKKALKSQGINPRSKAEAVNTVIDNFLINFYPKEIKSAKTTC